MKSTIFTFLMFIGISAFSQLGNLVFFTEDGELFYVSLNGIKINSTPMANVKIEGVKSPGGMATITFADASLGTVKKNVPAMDGHEYTFKVKRNKKGEWKINYFTDVVLGSTPVNANTTTNTGNDQVLIQQKVADPIVDQSLQSNTAVQNGTTVNSTTTNVQTTTANPGNGGISMNINMNGGQTTQQQTVTNTDVQPINTTTTTTTTTNTVNTTQANTNANPKGISLNVNINGSGINAAMNNLSNTVTTTITGTNTNSTTVEQPEASILIDNSAQQQQQQQQTVNPVSNDVVVSNQTTISNTSGCGMAMESADFNSAKASISSKSFEDSKMTVAKQVTENNCLSTAQIMEVMSLFSFEESKLDFAKFAYDYTTEKNKYYKINDAFTYSTSIDELQAYTKARK